jgi:hypothetical protein
MDKVSFLIQKVPRTLVPKTKKTVDFHYDFSRVLKLIVSAAPAKPESNRDKVAINLIIPHGCKCAYNALVLMSGKCLYIVLIRWCSIIYTGNGFCQV